ncbi:MAG TPA: Uma2 family endonuclease, partial [Ktedonobacteraceae bacterium]|nr:Uma2 family endonuclease [Ktedonobacteraceae bacterium]
VVEVLSPFTENVDRNEKIRNYQATPTIYEIVLINQFAVHVEVYERDEHDNTTWHLNTYGPSSDVLLASLDIHISIDELYADIDFSQPLQTNK